MVLPVLLPCRHPVPSRHQSHGFNLCSLVSVGATADCIRIKVLAPLRTSILHFTSDPHICQHLAIILNCLSPLCNGSYCEFGCTFINFTRMNPREDECMHQKPSRAASDIIICHFLSPLEIWQVRTTLYYISLLRRGHYQMCIVNFRIV